LGNKKENLAAFNLADFCSLPNRQNKFYTRFSSYTVYWISNFKSLAKEGRPFKNGYVLFEEWEYKNNLLLVVLHYTSKSLE